ncbi:MAG: carboxypeptidase regulatory-like domain-containing protein, partial [Acidobacteria bacterium]|nr:carboxypeptidase regulatory-like domain-containing protein [Acidobacteriota bacterium]
MYGMCGPESAIQSQRPDGVTIGHCCYHSANQPCHDCQQPGGQSTSIIGTVLDSSGQPLADVTVNSTGASRSATTAADGSFLIEMSSGGTHWLTFEIGGHIPVRRSADVPEGQHQNMGVIHMATADPLVTTITPDGGTAVDSTGDVELQFPAGALSTATDFRLTVIPSSREIPGPLNSGENIQYPIAYTNCVIFDPGDVALAQPVTMRIRNRWGFPAGYKLPTAFYDTSANKWVPDGLFLTVSADGTMLEKQLTSLGAPGASQQRARSARTSAAADAPSVIGIHDGNASASTSASHDDQK